MNRQERRASAATVRRLAKVGEWDAFEPVHVPDATVAEYLGRKVRYRGAFRNSLFAVQVFHRDVEVGLTLRRIPHLAIRRHDGAEIQGWDTMQRIKNEIAGSRAIAVEVFPAADDLVNEANMRHLFVWDSCPFTIKGPWT